MTESTSNIWKSESLGDHWEFTLLDQRPIELLPEDLREALDEAIGATQRVAIEARDVMLPSPWLKTLDHFASQAESRGGSLGLIIGEDEYFNAKTADMLGLQNLKTFPTLDDFLKS